MTTIIIVAGLTLLASFTCSLLEAALYSITPTQVELLKQGGGSRAQRLARLRTDIEEPIAAILTINTIAHTVGAAWCGAMVGKYYGSNAVGIFAAVFTVLVLAVTEIVPKSLGVRYASVLGTIIVWPVQLMIWSVWPVVWIAKRAMRLIGPGGTEGPTEEEIVVLAGLAAKAGGVRPEEQRWVANALRLDRMTAGDLRTPRTVVESFPADTRLADAVAHPERWAHSRVPVTDGEDRDKLIGLVHRREAFEAALANEDGNLILADLVHEIGFVPEAMPAHKLLNTFLDKRAHMMAVVDEYGGFEGVVTLEDVLECLLGREIVDEHDRVEDMQVLALERSRERRP